MNEAQRFDTTTGGELASPTSDWPIGEIEGPISGLRNTIGIMEHMATSAHEVTRDEWATMTTILSGYAKQIDDLSMAAPQPGAIASGPVGHSLVPMARTCL